MTIAIVSLGVGIIAGWLGQRSRFCSIGGFRDFILTRDKTLLMGIVGLFLAAWLLYPLVNTRNLLAPPELVEGTESFSLQDPITEAQLQVEEEKLSIPKVEILIFVSALSVGFISLLNDGCPFRQHVLAGSGLQTAIYYLIGFYFAALVFDFWSSPLLRWFF